jgi:hypothetical protein
MISPRRLAPLLVLAATIAVAPAAACDAGNLTSRETGSVALASFGTAQQTSHHHGAVLVTVCSKSDQRKIARYASENHVFSQLEIVTHNGKTRYLLSNATIAAEHGGEFKITFQKISERTGE